MKELVSGDYVLLFEQHPELSPEACIRKAEEIVNGPVRALDWQGANSYTLASNDEKTVVQFRSAASPLDPNVLDMARVIHGELVPRSSLIGNMPNSTAAIWTMDKVPAVDMNHLHEDPNLRHKLVRTVHDMARFFAAAWKAPQQVNIERRTEVYRDYELHLSNLSQQHEASELKSRIDHIRSRLWDILQSLPWVLTHGDVEPLNLLLDEDTAQLRGVVDWADASVLPFGTDLTGLDAVLGYSNENGWHWRVEDVPSHHRAFRDVFLTEVGSLGSATYNDIEDARVLSLFLRYGRSWKDGKFVAVPRDDVVLQTLLAQDAIFS